MRITSAYLLPKTVYFPLYHINDTISHEFSQFHLVAELLQQSRQVISQIRDAVVADDSRYVSTADRDSSPVSPVQVVSVRRTTVSIRISNQRRTAVKQQQ